MWNDPCRFQNPLIQNQMSSPGPNDARFGPNSMAQQDMFIPSYADGPDGLMRVSGFAPLETEIQRKKSQAFFLFYPFIKIRRILKETEERSKKIDYFSRIGFPFFFFFFTIIYLVVYTCLGT